MCGLGWRSAYRAVTSATAPVGTVACVGESRDGSGETGTPWSDTARTNPPPASVPGLFGLAGRKSPPLPLLLLLSSTKEMGAGGATTVRGLAEAGAGGLEGVVAGDSW